jgi:multisubunit Na+/H+ antiporter MnhC subunit
MIEVVMIVGGALLVVGFWGMLTRRNMIKIVLGLSIAETGLQILMVSIGYLHGRTAPILDAAVPVADAAARIVDPIPQALVLTSIVIGVAVNALLLAFVVNLYGKKKTLDIDAYTELKW